MFANHIGYSDVTPHEVIRKISEKTLEIREMNYERDPTFKLVQEVGGFSAHTVNNHEQRWLITPDPTRPVFRIRQGKSGQWKDKYGHRYSLSDTPRRFYDYNF